MTDNSLSTHTMFLKHQDSKQQDKDKPADEVNVRPSQRWSKTQRKLDQQALLTLGQMLVALPLSQLKKMDFSDPIRTAIDDSRRFTSHGAKRRQMLFLVKLLNSIDPLPYVKHLERLLGARHLPEILQRLYNRPSFVDDDDEDIY